MSAPLNFWRRLAAVLIPTVGQSLFAILLALVLLYAAQTHTVLAKLGITAAALSATSAQFHDRFDAILRSAAASQLALITFWATIGLVAYLVCWGAYNILIEARNELTLTTTYTNRSDPSVKHWRGPIETLALKAVAGAGLALIIGSLWYGISFWLTLSSDVIQNPSLTSALTAIAAVIGFAAHLYLAFAFIQLTFTPWYRAETFTQS
jgi:hypothetical protein